jgi:hypothetical protein
MSSRNKSVPIFGDPMVVIKDIVQLSKQQSTEQFRTALNNACGEINEAARLSVDIFGGDELKMVRRELARLMEVIDSKLLSRLDGHTSENG